MLGSIRTAAVSTARMSGTTASRTVQRPSVVVTNQGQRCRAQFRWTNNNSSSSSSKSSNNNTATAANASNASKPREISMLNKPRNQQELDAYLEDANTKMEAYHEAAQLMRQGKLPNRNAHRGPKSSIRTQFFIAGVFVVMFSMTPFIGKKIAKDAEFRQKYIPAWYDYTVEKPESLYTREEMHEHIMQLQLILRERAIAGDFEPDKLQKMQDELDEVDMTPEERLQRERERGWNKMDPGMEDGEKFNEA